MGAGSAMPIAAAHLSSIYFIAIDPLAVAPQTPMAIGLCTSGCLGGLEQVARLGIDQGAW